MAKRSKKFTTLRFSGGVLGGETIRAMGAGESWSIRVEIRDRNVTTVTEYGWTTRSKDVVIMTPIRSSQETSLQLDQRVS